MSCYTDWYPFLDPLKCFLYQKPDKDEWGSGLEALETALALEKTVNQSLLDLHKIADKHGDAQVITFKIKEITNTQKFAVIILKLEQWGYTIWQYVQNIHPEWPGWYHSRLRVTSYTVVWLLPRGGEFKSQSSRITFVEMGYEIVSTAILYLLLIKVVQ